MKICYLEANNVWKIINCYDIMLNIKKRKGKDGMALIKCPECGKEISDQAKECKYCGYPIKISKKKNINNKIIVSALAIVFIIGVIFFAANKLHKIHPYEIKYGNEVISYYDSEDEILQLSSSIEIRSKLMFWDDSYPISVYIDRGKIRMINIESEDVTVYGNISVGDNISKIANTFDYEQEVNNGLYTVLFSNNKEVDENSVEYNDNNLYIYFYSADDIINRISILDAKCAFTAM